MSIHSDTAEAQPPYASLEELSSIKKWPRKSAAGCRLFWQLTGPFPETISVMDDNFDPGSLTPYFSNGTFHSISQEPVSEPKVSSVTVKVRELDDWERAWLEQHNEHGDGAGEPSRWFGTLDGYDSDDSDKEEHLMGCCEEPRPRGKKIRIVVRPAAGNFVTVHDYVSTVHPWLMGFKEDMMKAYFTIFGDYSVSDLMVSPEVLDDLSIDSRSHWIEFGRKEPVYPSTFVPDNREIFSGPEPQSGVNPAFPSYEADEKDMTKL